ncbi:MAG: prepilin-type N-terminal cleavage/methylation domain-containing protein [Planctomycetota bacterium]
MTNRVNHTASSRAFTLMEILIVVVILGVLSAITVPAISGTTDDARKTSFVSSLKTYVKAVQRYRIDNGAYPADGSSGVIPAGLDVYVDENNFNSVTPIGGVWDTELGSYGVTAAIGVHFDGSGDTQNDAYMATIDAMLDDGDLAAGAFQRIDGGRYYYILAD